MRTIWLYDHISANGTQFTVSFDLRCWLFGAELSANDLLVCAGPLNLMWSW